MTKLRFCIPVLAALISVGCANQQVDKLQTLNRKCEEQVVDLTNQIKEANARIAALQAQGAPQTVQDPALLNQLEQLRGERNQLDAKVRQLEADIRRLAATDVRLPVELDTALKDFARQHSDIVTYDAAHGMVKLASDLTFAPGSTDVSDNGQRTLAQLARIISSPAASGFEARVVGHTDNVPIRKSNTKQNHPTNWHLSVHRAIAVKDALDKAGVPAIRMGVAGYGEYRPIAANGSKGNEVNRRVEIYIVPSTQTGIPVVPAAEIPEASSVRPAAKPRTTSGSSQTTSGGAEAGSTSQPAPVEDYFK